MIGVLALQGAFQKHALSLQKVGIETVFVRTPAELHQCAGLVIPGGESTTMRRLLQEMDMLSTLREYSQHHPVFGTCAGLILMAADLGVIDVEIERNGFGSQVHSFSHQLESVDYPELTGIFIRAPRIRQCGKDVEVLATYKGEPVLVKNGQYLAATFHPELTDDLRLHRTFVSMVKGVKFPTDHLISSTENGREGDDGRPAKTQIG